VADGTFDCLAHFNLSDLAQLVTGKKITTAEGEFDLFSCLRRTMTLRGRAPNQM
jgi:hypothetical protein